MQSSPPIITKFSISGLHGYKDVVIDFDAPEKIIIAENGSGKTTILYALYSFLSGNLLDLKSIDFETISCDFISGKSIALEKSVLKDLEIVGSQVDHFKESLMISGRSESELQSILASAEGKELDIQMQTSGLLEEFYENSPYSWDEAKDRLLELKQYYDKFLSEDFLEIQKIVKAEIKNKDVLYLPTYRRIERDLASSMKSRSVRRSERFSHRRRRDILGGTHMYYGLRDVEEKIRDLTESLQHRMNMEYRQTSARIIDELLAGKLDAEIEESEPLPNYDDITRFLSRIGGRRGGLISNFDKIQSLYEGTRADADINVSVLRYFISKLSVIVRQTRRTEERIEIFVAKVNEYLNTTSDVKQLEYDAGKMKVSIRNIWTEKNVSFNDLSSGEKQVVSLLSHLYLYPNDKIILIDEPELSLSIDWQRKILVDIASASSCKQMLAITHSPFIFENELDGKASALRIIRKHL